MDAAEIRRHVEGRERSARGVGYPPELRLAATDHAFDRRGVGWTWNRIGRELGISSNTLRLWCDPHERIERVERGLVPVEVTDRSAVSPPLARPVLVSPSGWRVEGLTVDEAVTLLGALG